MLYGVCLSGVIVLQYRAALRADCQPAPVMRRAFVQMAQAQSAGVVTDEYINLAIGENERFKEVHCILRMSWLYE